MGKATGFLEIRRHDRSYLPVEERVKHYSEFVIPLGDEGTRQQAAVRPLPEDSATVHMALVHLLVRDISTLQG